MPNPPITRVMPHNAADEQPWELWVPQTYAENMAAALLSLDILREKMVRLSKRIACLEASVRTAQQLRQMLDDARDLAEIMHNNMEARDR